jgi:thioredoxin-like negative regulator of GroEL
VVLGRELDSFAEKIFVDRLLLLSALHLSADPASTPLLEELKREAAGVPEQAADLLSWFNGNAMPVAAISWASQLPPETLSQKAVPIALADAYIAAGDWTGMRAIVKTGNWGSIDYLRSALAARASRELREESDAAAQWAEARQKVSNAPKQALTLAEVVQKWGWRDEAIELLWIAAKDPVTGDDALQALYTYFAQQQATQDLYRVLLHRQGLRPDDRAIQNNVAQLSLLLNLNVERAQKLARDLYESEPKNAVYASTYAYALHAAGDSKKAEKVLAGLTPEQLRQPEIAAYYGVILAGTGDHARAAEFLDLSEKAGLLPEERALVEKARRMVARR